MYKKVLPYMVLFIVMNLVVWAIQMRLLRGDLERHFIFFKFLGAFVVFMSCLTSLKKEHTLTYGRSFVICLIILIPGVELSSLIIQLLLFHHYFPNWSIPVFATHYGFPFLATALASCFFINKKTAE